MIVFKGKPGKTTEKLFTVANNFPPDVVCVCQEKEGWGSQTLQMNLKRD